MSLADCTNCVLIIVLWSTQCWILTAPSRSPNAADNEKTSARHRSVSVSKLLGIRLEHALTLSRLLTLRCLSCCRRFSGAGFTPLFVARVLEEHGRGTSSPAAAAQQVTIRWYHHVTPGTSWKSSVRNPKQNIEESCVGRRRIHATLTVLYSQTLLCVPARCRLIWVPCLFVGRSGTNCLYKYLFQKQNKKQ